MDIYLPLQKRFIYAYIVELRVEQLLFLVSISSILLKV